MAGGINDHIHLDRAKMKSQSRVSPGLVAVIVYDGLSLFEYGCAVEVFGLPRPEMGDNWYRFATCAAESGMLRGSGGIQVQPDDGLELLAKAKTIIVPGWRGIEAPVPTELCHALRKANERGARVMSICTGAFVLAAAGLLDGKRATTHWRHAAVLAARYPKVRVEADVLYIDAGDVLTSAGSAAGIDLCLHLIRRDLGPHAANQVARRLVMPPHREGGQAQYIEEPVSKRSNSSLAPLLDAVRATLGEEWSIERMAAQTATSTRTFQRHFVNAMGMPPGEWLLMERMARARVLLEETDLSMDEISVQVGFVTASTLRNHFRTRLGTSPGTYRRRFKISETR
ncbi:transcriptional regulator FtrA [Crenobacter sp. SG2305]|uniref:transcriptional regulator FtrA n=1 Tax=Crenobacter oryzisoli TaxID=3056844 RepID=UPI0025AAD6AC|nr:transcriptional regulator FtrA [Crenobacter sp. SG2305]MDN0084529.1 transcriptional regulator FtrA [Crenobacter sp. SG2305]